MAGVGVGAELDFTIRTWADESGTAAPQGENASQIRELRFCGAGGCAWDRSAGQNAMEAFLAFTCGGEGLDHLDHDPQDYGEMLIATTHNDNAAP